jgi:5-methylcytosine-specific restriction endonuclease McrA
MAAYYAANREKMIERSSKRNAALAAAGVRRLSQAQISAQNAKRKAARRGMNGSHTAAELDALMVFQGHLCTYCRIDLSTVPYHADHKTPLARGGSNDIGNMQMLCAPCNMRKHATTHEEFLMRLALDAARRNHADPEAIELLPVGMAA